MSMFVGEALEGEGNEIAHIDLLIGSKDGPVGVAFAKIERSATGPKTGADASVTEVEADARQ